MFLARQSEHIQFVCRTFYKVRQFHEARMAESLIIHWEIAFGMRLWTENFARKSYRSVPDTGDARAPQNTMKEPSPKRSKTRSLQFLKKVWSLALREKLYQRGIDFFIRFQRCLASDEIGTIKK
jgi:hypothetical protein